MTDEVFSAVSMRLLTVGSPEDMFVEGLAFSLPLTSARL